MHVKLLVDGIPTNVNSGVGDINAIFPLDIDRIEVVKGTNDPRYGLFNIAGNVQVFTSAPGRYTQGEAARRRLRHRRPAGRHGVLDRPGVRTSTSAASAASAGYRDNSDLDRHAFSGKWLYSPASGAWTRRRHRPRLRLRHRGARLSDAQQAAADATAVAGLLGHRRRRAADAPRQPASRSPVRRRSRCRSRATGRAFASQRFVRFTAAGAQQERLEDETQTGAPRHRHLAADARWPHPTRSLSAGVDCADPGQRRAALRHRRPVRGAVLRDQAFDFSPRRRLRHGRYCVRLRWLRVTGGLRADRVGGDFSQRAGGQRCRSSTTAPSGSRRSGSWPRCARASTSMATSDARSRSVSERRVRDRPAEAVQERRLGGRRAAGARRPVVGAPRGVESGRLR